MMENKELIIKYHFMGGMIALFFRIILGLFGYFLIHLDNTFGMVVGGFLLVLAMIKILDHFLFVSLTLNEQGVTKKWYFGSSTLKLDKLQVFKRNSSFGGGGIFFWEEGKRFKQVLFHSVDLMPLTKEEIQAIKKKLIQLKHLQGDEYEWME